MKALFAFAILVIAGLPSAAQAIDCARAASPIERTICGDPDLVRADSAMNRAYAAILKAAPDPEIHTMLVNSQKRWIAARDKSFGRTSQTGTLSLQAARSAFVLAATEGRITVLKPTADAKPTQFYLIQTALRQRHFAAPFTGGSFTGFDTACDFFPGSGAGDEPGYACFATHFFQNDDRICSQANDWATYRVYTTGGVADLVDGKPQLVATCKDDGCDDGAASGWNRHPDPTSAPALARSLPKLDAEVMDSMVDEEPSWLKACLTDKRFPLAQSGK